MELRSTFDRVAKLYDRARPSYPPELIDVVAALGTSILEIGPGSGQATRALAERGARVTAIEVGRQLAKIAQRNVPSARVVHADFDVWEAGSADFDAVVAFNSFHWLDAATKYGKSARLLRTGGALAVTEVEHVRIEGGDPYWVESQEDYDAIVPSPDNRPPPLPEDVGDLRPELEASGLFGDVVVRRYRSDVSYTADDFIDLLGTYSPNIARDPATTRRLFERLRARIAARPTETVTVHYLFTLNVART